MEWNEYVVIQGYPYLSTRSWNGTSTQLYRGFPIYVPGSWNGASTFPYLHTWVMEWNKYIVIKRFLYSSQCRRHDFGCSINHLDQVIIHRSRDIEHKGQSGGPWGNIFLWGDKSWPQKKHKQKTASHGHTHGQNITARLGQWNNVIREESNEFYIPQPALVVQSSPHAQLSLKESVIRFIIVLN